MRFLIDAGLPRGCSDLLRSLGHEAIDVRDLQLQSDDHLIAEYAQNHDCCLLTRDGDFGDIREYPPEMFAGIVVFRFESRAEREHILGVVSEFASTADMLRCLRGRLAIVTADRVRLRPATDT